jgi:hypothetical protein
MKNLGCVCDNYSVIICVNFETRFFIDSINWIYGISIKKLCYFINNSL